MKPNCERNAVRESEQSVPATSCRKVTTSPCQRLFGLRYAYLLVDEIIVNCTEALQRLNRATRDVSSVTKWWSNRWLGQRGRPKDNCVLVPIRLFKCSICLKRDRYAKKTSQNYSRATLMFQLERLMEEALLSVKNQYNFF